MALNEIFHLITGIWTHSNDRPNSPMTLWPIPLSFYSFVMYLFVGYRQIAGIRRSPLDKILTPIEGDSWHKQVLGTHRDIHVGQEGLKRTTTVRYRDSRVSAFPPKQPVTGPAPSFKLPPVDKKFSPINERGDISALSGHTGTENTAQLNLSPPLLLESPTVCSNRLDQVHSNQSRGDISQTLPTNLCGSKNRQER